MNTINIDKQIQDVVKDLPDYNYMLGRTLMQPFKPANSGSRALMNSIHVEHLMVLSNGEVPIVQTGFETEFGRNSTSFVTAENNYEVLYRIDKFSFNRNHYYLILRNLDNGEYDVIERVTYKHNTESYGYMWDNSRIDNLAIGDTISAGDVIKTSIGYDEYGNKMNGVNLVTMYLSCAQNMEDSIIISETAAHKLETNLIKNTSIMINDNDILLDLYGDGVTHKAFPDIGERVKDGIFCSIRRVEIIKNQSTCINRENIGQLHEQSLTFIGMRILDYFKLNVMPASDMCKEWFRFVQMVDPEQAQYAADMVDFDNERQAAIFIDSIMEDDAIILSTPPFTTPINLDTIRAIYDAFPYIKPYRVMMPMEDSNGNIRYVPSRRPLVVGKIYNYRLKQYAEEKFSVTSLSATNLKNLNTRSKANKIYESKYTKTPIMFGPMESGDLAHLGMQYVVMNLMLYSSSPQARRLFEQLLIGDPYDIDIKLDADSKNRNAEIINALLKSMGLRLVFTKKLKAKKVLCKNILYKTVPNSEWQPKTNIREIIGNDDLLELQYATARMHKCGKPLYKQLLTRGVDQDGNREYKTNINDIIARAESEQSDDVDQE